METNTMTDSITFPEYNGIRCLMLPYIQGEPDSVPTQYRGKYDSILEQLCLERGKIGFLTIDESPVIAGNPHRGQRAKYGRALHTEAGRNPIACWGGGGNNWGGKPNVTLDHDTRILLANSLNATCAVWDAVHENTSLDGDIGDCASDYPYHNARFLKAGEIAEIGIFTPHESIPVERNCLRQFIRIVGSGVHGREPYFTENPLLNWSER